MDYPIVGDKMENKMIGFLAIAVAVGLAAGAGIGYLVFDEDPVEETYWYYLYFADGDERNKWYSATGSDATVAFDKAMDDAGFEWTKSKWGYISTIDGVGSSWATYNYLWSITTSEAAESSISGKTNDQYGAFAYSNGWKSYSGFDIDKNIDPENAEKMKFFQSNSNIFILTTYDALWAANITPVTGYDDWKASGPFAA